MATNDGGVTPQMVRILAAVSAGKSFKSPAGVVPKMVEMGLLDYGDVDVVLTAKGKRLAKASPRKSSKKASPKRSSVRKSSPKKTSRKASPKKASPKKASPKKASPKRRSTMPSQKRTSQPMDTARKKLFKAHNVPELFDLLKIYLGRAPTSAEMRAWTNQVLGPYDIPTSVQRKCVDSTKKASSRKSSPKNRKSPKRLTHEAPPLPSIRRGPYTSGDVERFNRLTHFPRTVEQWNASYWEDVDQLTNWVTERMVAYGIDVRPEDVEEALRRYRRALHNRGLASIRSREVAPPWTITGRSNYKGKPDKARGIDEKAHNAVEHARSKVVKAVKKYSPRAAVSSDDPEAVKKLQKKIDDLEHLQATMKAANKIVRTKGFSRDQKAEKLSKLVTPRLADELLTPDYMGRLGFPAYELQNNNANIRRLKQRIEDLRATQAMPEQEFEFDGGTLAVNVSDNRVQLFFDGKPDEAIRKALRSHGFVWARSIGAWQRKLSNDAIYWAKDVLKDHGMPVQEPEAAGEDDSEPPTTTETERILASTAMQEEMLADKTLAFDESAERVAELPDPRATATRKRVAPELIITHSDAFEKLTKIEGAAWAKREKKDAAEPNTFFDAQAGFQILIDDGLVGQTTKDPDTGKTRKILIGDITGSSGFSGAGEEVYIVLDDGQVALFGDSASSSKIAKARNVLKIIGDPTPCWPGCTRPPPPEMDESAPSWLTELRKGQKIRITSDGLPAREVEVTQDASVIVVGGSNRGVRVYVTSGATRAAPAGGTVEWWDAQEGVVYQPTMTQSKFRVKRIDVLSSPEPVPALTSTGLARMGKLVSPRVGLPPDAAKRLAGFRKVMDKGIQEIDGMNVDLTTASIVLQVYDGISEQNKLKYMSKSVPEIIDIAYKIASKSM